MLMTHFSVADSVGCGDNGDGSYRIDYADGTSRLATTDEIATAQAAYEKSLIRPVTRRQFKLALLAIGLLDDVEAMISASDNRSLQINYAEALDFERSNPFVIGMAQALGKSDAEIDALFALAASL